MILTNSDGNAKARQGFFRQIWLAPFLLALSLSAVPAWSKIRTPSPERIDALSAFHPRNLDAIESGKKVRMKAATPLKLSLKRYSRPEAQPVLLIHGLAQNDRGLDAHNDDYNFAKHLYEQGFDVWIGNMRSAGTPGFKSETPPGPHHWTVDDYAVDDLPALVQKVRETTEKKPFLVGHSLGAWMIDGYLAGLEFDPYGYVQQNPELRKQREDSIRGIVTVAGLYGVEWENTLDKAWKNPIRTEQEYYHSNYELELLAQADPLYYIIPELPALPLNWIGTAFNLPLGEFPLVGSSLDRLYRRIQSRAIETPVLTMFMYPANTDPKMLQDHVSDGMEDLGPKLVQQIANTYNCRARLSFHSFKSCPGGKEKSLSFNYDQVRRESSVPILFIAGNQDRLASAHQIYHSGLLRSGAKDKAFRLVEGFGHLDILSGINAKRDVMTPVANWMKKRTP